MSHILLAATLLISFSLLKSLSVVVDYCDTVIAAERSDRIIGDACRNDNSKSQIDHILRFSLL